MSQPPEVNTVTWAGISPPRGGWRALGETDAATLESAARAGIDEVAEAIPEGTGEQLVQRVRSEVWGAASPELEYVPAGAAFARVQPRLPRRRRGAPLRDRARGRASRRVAATCSCAARPWTLKA